MTLYVILGQKAGNPSFEHKVWVVKDFCGMRVVAFIKPACNNTVVIPE